MARIEYYFTVLSPWAYLGHDAFARVSHRHAAEIAFKPFSLGLVFPETGGVPLGERHPARRAYRLIEMRRWSAFRQVPLTLHPKHFPVNPALADRTIIAALDAGADLSKIDALVRACFRAVWTDDLDIASATVVQGLVDAAGLDGDALGHAASEDGVVGRYAAHSAEAVASGVVGSPGYVLNGEPFWGQDRIELLDAALSASRGPFRAEEPAPNG